MLMSFIFVQNLPKMQPCTWCVLPRCDWSLLRRWWGMCADIWLEKASYIDNFFIHMQCFSFWPVLLFYIQIASSWCAVGTQIISLASRLYSLLSMGEAELRWCSCPATTFSAECSNFYYRPDSFWNGVIRAPQIHARALHLLVVQFNYTIQNPVIIHLHNSIM